VEADSLGFLDMEAVRADIPEVVVEAVDNPDIQVDLVCLGGPDDLLIPIHFLDRPNIHPHQNNHRSHLDHCRSHVDTDFPDRFDLVLSMHSRCNLLKELTKQSLIDLLDAFFPLLNSFPKKDKASPVPKIVRPFWDYRKKAYVCLFSF